MTFGELKLVCLQKVFAVSDGRVVVDDTTREYITAIPGAANEGLQLLATAGKKLKRKLVLEQGTGENPSVRPEGGQLPYEGEPSGAGGFRRYDLTEIAEDFYCLDADGVYFEGGGRYGRAGEFYIEAGRVLVLPAGAVGVWTVWYSAYPARLTAETADEYELPLTPEAAALLPLYVASQIYKDDDISLATQYRNEFEIGREALILAARESGGGGRDTWSSINGWW